MCLNAATVFVGEGSIVKVFVLSYDVECIPHGSMLRSMLRFMLRKGEKKTRACHLLTVSTFGPASVAVDNLYSPWYMKGRLCLLLKQSKNRLGQTF